MALPAHDVAETDPGRWEYREETVVLRGELGLDRFWYRGDNELDRKRAYDEAWNLARPLLEGRLNELGREGWHLTKPLDFGLVYLRHGGDWKPAVLFFLGFVTVLVTWIPWLWLVFFGKDQWFEIIDAKLPLRRVSASRGPNRTQRSSRRHA